MNVILGCFLVWEIGGLMRLASRLVHKMISEMIALLMGASVDYDPYEKGTGFVRCVKYGFLNTADMCKPSTLTSSG